jgi:hypothetical protein
MGDLEKDIAALVESKTRRRTCELLHGMATLMADPAFSVEPLRALLESASDLRDTRAGMLASDEEYMLRAVVNALEGK